MSNPRGGQKDNTNALKHGFYSLRFRKQELNNLEALLADGQQDLASEIALLRVAMSRTFAQVTKAEDTNEPIDWIAYLHAIGLAATRLAAILKTQKILEGNQGDLVNAALIQAITDYSKEENLSV